MDNAVKGVVASGMGEGAFFMSMPHYKNEIMKKLGFAAYPGTLNIKINPKHFDVLKKLNPIAITGFVSGAKKFGATKCYVSKIKNIQGAVIVPDLTKHGNDIMEFIAPVHVKTKLKIKDGDEVSIELQ